MTQKSTLAFTESEQNPKETLSTHQKCVARLEKHFDEEFPPLTAQEGGNSTTQNNDANLFDLGTLGVFCGSKKNLPPRPLSGKSSKKQASEISGKESIQKSQNRDIPAKEEQSHPSSNKGTSEVQSPVERLYAHVKKKSSDSSHGGHKKESLDSPLEEQARTSKNSLDGKILKRIVHKVSGSNVSNTSNSSYATPTQTANHTRNNSGKLPEKLRKDSEETDQRGESNALDKSKPTQNNEQNIGGFANKNGLDEKENPSDFFNFYKGELFDQDPVFGVAKSKFENIMTEDILEELKVQPNEKAEQDDEEGQQEEEEDVQPWLIPLINRESKTPVQQETTNPTQSNKSQNLSNSGIKPSNGSFMSGESTFDSDQYLNYDLINTSLSARSNSFYNSKSNDHNTPTKMDSFRRAQQDAFNGSQMQFMPWMGQPYNPDPRNQFAFLPLNSNQSAIQFNQSYSGSDRSDDLFNSNWGTPQGQNQQQFFSQNFTAFNPNGYREQIQFANQNYHMNQSMILPNYQNSGPNSSHLAYKQRQAGNYQKLKGRNQKRIPEGDESSQFYDIYLDRLKSDPRTTLMIKNIPNKYDQPLLLQTINKNHQDKFDFFYLPIDFKNKCNVGYAFINFIDPIYIKEFFEEFDGKKWNKFNSEKICRIKYGRIQGLNALVQHFEASSVMNQQDKKLKPLILTKNSKNAGKNTNIFPKHNLQNIEQLVRQQKATLSDEEADDQM